MELYIYPSLYKSVLFSIRIAAAPPLCLAKACPFFTQTYLKPLFLAVFFVTQKSLFVVVVKYLFTQIPSSFSARRFFIHRSRVFFSVNLTNIGATRPSLALSLWAASTECSDIVESSSLSEGFFTKSRTFLSSDCLTPWISITLRLQFCSFLLMAAFKFVISHTWSATVACRPVVFAASSFIVLFPRRF